MSVEDTEKIHLLKKSLAKYKLIAKRTHELNYAASLDANQNIVDMKAQIEHLQRHIQQLTKESNCCRQQYEEDIVRERLKILHIAKTP